MNYRVYKMLYQIGSCQLELLPRNIFPHLICRNKGQLFALVRVFAGGEHTMLPIKWHTKNGNCVLPKVIYIRLANVIQGMANSKSPIKNR